MTDHADGLWSRLRARGEWYDKREDIAGPQRLGGRRGGAGELEAPVNRYGPSWLGYGAAILGLHLVGILALVPPPASIPRSWAWGSSPTHLACATPSTPITSRRSTTRSAGWRATTGRLWGSGS